MNKEEITLNILPCLLREENEIKSSFSSTQFDLNSEDTKSIQDFIKEFINEEDLHEYGVEKNSHITIKFGLHDELPNKLRPLLLENNITPITVMLGKTSIFEAEEFDVVKIDIISGELRKLNKLISKNLDNTDTFPTYKPHLTLAYVQKGMGEKYIGDITFDGKIITFNKLTFSPSKLDDTFLQLSEENNAKYNYQKSIMNKEDENEKNEENE